MEGSTRDEIKSLIETFIKDLDIHVPAKLIDEFAAAFRGLDEPRIMEVLNRAYENGGSLEMEDKRLILEEKARLINETGLLEVIPAVESMDDLGGLEEFKEWLYRKEFIFKQLEKARQFGVSNPRGVLLAGAPGCGKSLGVKAAADLFDVPLVRLNVARLSGQDQAQGESNLKKALELSEMISPCILWIDEMEILFASAPHLSGPFLTWMQENTEVFIAATINDSEKLPDRFLRTGFFDHGFSVDLPHKEERRKILDIHLRKRKKWNRNLDIPLLVTMTEGYSGADLEALVEEAIENCFIQRRDALTEEDFRQAQNYIHPASEVFPASVGQAKEAIQRKCFKDAGSDEGKIAVRLWDAGERLEKNRGPVSPLAVTLREVLGRDWWKKRGAKFIDRKEWETVEIESGSWGYGIDLI